MNFEYKKDSHLDKHTLDLYIPENKTNLIKGPLLVYVHGGKSC